MKRTLTLINGVDSHTRLQSYILTFPKWKSIHNSFASKLFIGLFFLLFTWSLSGQQLQQLDTYLTSLDKEGSLESPIQISSHVEFIKSQLYDLVSTVYWLDRKVSFQQSGQLVRMVTNANDLFGISGMTEKMGDELSNVRSLVIKIPDEMTMQSVREIDLKIYEILPSLERALFILEYETNPKELRQLESKLPQQPIGPTQNQTNPTKRSPIVFLYKISIPS